MPSRSSGLDFKDRTSPLDAHPDVSAGRANLQRNRTERRRLQAIVRSDTVKSTSPSAESYTPRTLKEKYRKWMINDGGRKMFFAVFIILHFFVVLFGFLNYELKDNTVNARATFGITYPIARTAALVLHIDVIFILLPICRNFISILRRSPLNDIIPFDKNIEFHVAVGWSIVVFTAIHIVAHMVNFVRLGMSMSKQPGKVFVAFLGANFATGPGITGWIMTVVLIIMVVFASDKQRKKNFEKFFYTHHLFIIFFINWQFHGMFCMIKPDRAPYCSSNTIGVFWRYWLVGGVIYIFERILREVRSRHRTYISKVIQHPSQVIEIQIKKEKTTSRAGQYIFVNCPQVSYFQWHPFTLTSAPEEDYLSIHVRIVGDFTKAFAKSLGCEFEASEKGANKADEKDEKDRGSKVVTTQSNKSINKLLPRIMIDGPFGSASEDFFKFETIVLVGGGIGVTPFASILKTIWYRMNNFSSSKPTRLSKVYFIWVIRDFEQAEWFHSLLHAIEEQDSQNRIEISIYLTGKIQLDEINNIVVQDVGADRDAITSLRAPTHFGRPNWDRVFSLVTEKHPDTDVGVFFCGPPAMSKTLHLMCNKHTNTGPRGTRFFYGKENF